MAIHASIAKESAVRKGCLVKLFEERAVIDNFVAQHWPNRHTDGGRKRYEYFRKYRELNERLLQGGSPEGSKIIDPPSATGEPAFPLERHLRDFIAGNLQRITVAGRKLTLFVDSTGRSGVEYPTGVGSIDILAVDEDGSFCVFELKVDHGPDRALGQLARYMGWVKLNLANDEPVTGIIVANSINKKLRYAASIIPEVMLLEYEIQFQLRNADAIELVTASENEG